MLSTFLIATREGLEASLIIGILIAYLVRSGRRSSLPFVWLGVGVAILLALGFGAILTFTSTHLSLASEQLFAGITSLAAVALVTWMVFWMRNNARSIAKEIHGKVDTALAMGKVALTFTALLTVAREGLETSLFLYANFKTVRHNTAPLAGLILGIFAAVILGVLLYKRSININLSKFFRVTGVALIVVAGGVLIHGINEFQLRGQLPGVHSYAWNFGGSNSIFMTLLDGSIGIADTMTWLQLAVYLAYLGITLGAFLKPLRSLNPAHPSDPSKKVTTLPTNA